MKTEWLHSKFPSQTEMIGHLYDRRVEDDEDAAKYLDSFLAAYEPWQKFKMDIRKGDELWFFRSDVASWRKNEGKEGYCILRKISGVEFSNFKIEKSEIINSFLTVGQI